MRKLDNGFDKSIIKKMFILLGIISCVLAFNISVFAADSPISSGDTGFIMLSTLLVFIMTPALAFFYGGMVRKKNVLNTLMMSFFLCGMISIQWILYGYSVAFGPDVNHIFGNLSWIGLNGVTLAPNADYAATIPHQLFMAFQMMFAIITAALISGSLVDRMKFSSFIVFIFIWTTLVYDPLAHWVWGVGGWLRNIGALDFAGGTVVHISSGISALVAAIVLGKRKGHGKVPMTPHNLPFVLLGAALLWMGWFGFNAGSALSSNELAVSAFITTNTAAAAALLSWSFIEWMRYGKPTLLGAATGAVVGLVAITPGAGFVTPMSAIIIGLLVSPICYFAITFIKAKIGYDDALDVFGCHGVGGIWGALATGLFATKSVNALGNNGLFYGNPMQLGIQAIGVISTIAFAGILTFVILKVMSLFMKLRVTPEQEEAGLDNSQHGESAYGEIDGESNLAF